MLTFLPRWPRLRRPPAEQVEVNLDTIREFRVIRAQLAEVKDICLRIEQELKRGTA